MKLDYERIKLPTGGPNASMDEVRAFIRSKLAGGEKFKCPACGGTTGIYSRGLSKSNARALLMLARAPSGLRPVEIVETGTRDYPTLAYFGLAAKDGNGRNARWHITDKGLRFVRGEINIFAKVLVHNGKKVGVDERKTVSFADIAERDFDLSEVMSAEAVANANVADEVAA